MKKLKKALATTLAVLSAASALCMPVSASAMNTSTIYDLSQNYNASLPKASSSKTLSVTACTQEKNNWCWAACTKMLLGYYGEDISQEEIVKSVKGTNTAEDVTGTSLEVKDFLNSYMGLTSFKNNSGTFATIKTRISVGSPVILFGTESTSGGKSTSHAIICYGYDTSNSNNLKLKIIDPYTGSTGTLTCSSTSAKSFTMTVGSSTYTFSAEALVYTTTTSINPK